MTTYTKETALYDTGAISDDIDDAATQATNYLTDVSGGGVMVHPSDDSTSGWKISSALELLKSGVSYIWAGLVNNIATVRIGKETGGHSVIDENGMRIYGSSNGTTQLANIGYGRIETSPGVFQTAPYYTFGRRSNQSAIGFYSFATGSNTMADGAYSFSEGRETKALSQGSHSEGVYTEARGNYESFNYSHVAGVRTVSNGSGRYVIGAYNTDDLQVDTFTADGVNNVYQTTYSLPYLEWFGYDLMVSVDGYYVSKDVDGYGVMGGNKVYIRDVPSAGATVEISYPKVSHAFIIGNGTSNSARSNALTVDWKGDVCLALDTTAASGTTDGNLYAAIVAIGWQNNVIV